MELCVWIIVNAEIWNGWCVHYSGAGLCRVGAVIQLKLYSRLSVVWPGLLCFAAGLLCMLVSAVCCGAGELEIIINSIPSFSSATVSPGPGAKPNCCLIFVLPFYGWLTCLPVAGVCRRSPAPETWVLTNGSARCGGGRWQPAGPNLGRGSYYPVDTLLDMVLMCGW